MRIPKPVQLPSGSWRTRITVNGEVLSFTRDTAEESLAAALAVRSGAAPAPAPREKTLRMAVRKYIESRSHVLSPSTLRGYDSMLSYRFPDYMDKSVRSFDANTLQTMVNDEADEVSAKTVINAFCLVSASLRYAGMSVPSVALPEPPPPEPLWLDPDQIQIFLKQIYGRPGELPALFGLHSLRRSEIYALDWPRVDLRNGCFTVSGALVINRDKTYQLKPTNKTKNSTRTVPILIPRLKELLEAVPEEQRTGLVVTSHHSSLYAWTNKYCAEAGLPLIGAHGLRHTFASACWAAGVDQMTAMQIGGWSDPNTMRKIYTHLSDRQKNRGVEKLSALFSGSLPDSSPLILFPLSSKAG